MKYILEIKPEYEDSFKGLMILGAKDSNLFVDTIAVENLEELNSDYINEHFGDLQDTAYQKGLHDGESKCRYCNEYQRGLDDAWGCAKKLFSSMADSDIEKAFPIEWNNGGFNALINLQPQEAIEKLKAYEEKQKADDEIKVGDEVQHGDSTGIVYDAGDLIISGLLTDDGPFVPFQWYKQECKKTGRHFDIMTPKQLENGAIQWRIKK